MLGGSYMRFLQCISFRCRLIARVLVVLALSGFGVYHQTASGVAAAARCIREANDHTLSVRVEARYAFASLLLNRDAPDKRQAARERFQKLQASLGQSKAALEGLSTPLLAPQADKEALTLARERAREAIDETNQAFAMTLSLIDDRSHDEETNRAIGETVAHSTELVKESNAALLPLVQPYGLEELPVLPQ